MDGDREAGDWEKRGREVYGRREKRGQEAGEKGKITQHCTILCNKKMQRGGSQQMEGGNQH